MFAQNRDDKKRVEKALETSNFPSGKNDSIPVEKFQYEDFFNFYKNLTQRTEVERVFNELYVKKSSLFKLQLVIIVGSNNE